MFMTKRTATVSVLLLAAGIPASAQSVPRFETFFGYSYIRFNPVGNLPDFNAHGGVAQFIYNFHPRIALLGDLGGYHAAKSDGVRFDRNFATFLAGPRVSFRKKRTVSPYVQALFGGIRGNGAGRFGEAETAFAMLAGAGLNIKAGRHVALRPAEVSYFLTRLHNSLFDAERNQNNLLAAAGAAFLFGGEKPAPQARAARLAAVIDLSLGVHADRTEICQGETVALTPVLSANRGGVQYRWSLNGRPVSQDAKFQFGGNGLEPGAYRVGVTAGGAEYRPASTEVSITVLEYQPPTGAVQANPDQIYVGEQSTLIAAFQGQCGGPIQAPVFTASEGTVRDSQFDSSSVQFDPSVRSEQRKTVKISATAADNRTSGVAVTTITVVRRAAPDQVQDPRPAGAVDRVRRYRSCRFPYSGSIETNGDCLPKVNAFGSRTAIANKTLEGFALEGNSGGFANGEPDPCCRIRWTRPPFSGRV
jgi:hypothetical protein